MKIFTGPDKTVKDERVIMEYYRTGYISYVIIIFLILLDYVVRGFIFGNSDDVRTHLFIIAIPSFYFMITLVRKGVWMSGISKNRKIIYLITTAVMILIFNIIDRFSTGYLREAFTENEWISALFMLIILPVVIGISIIFIFLKISERNEEKLPDDSDK